MQLIQALVIVGIWQHQFSGVSREYSTVVNGPWLLQATIEPCCRYDTASARSCTHILCQQTQFTTTITQKSTLVFSTKLFKTNFAKQKNIILNIW